MLLISCRPEVQTPINHTVFGKLPGGEIVREYTLINKSGMELSVINYGGIVTKILLPDSTGNKTDVVLGFDSLESYEKDSPYFGALIGRVGNRINKGTFILNGITYSLAQNNNGNHLHGGLKGFDKVFWNIEPHTFEEGTGLILTYTGAAGEEGYPGQVNVKVVYILTERNEWIIRYEATTDKPTVINLTQHTYFNLHGSGPVTNHELMIAASQYLPVDSLLIPDGSVAGVSDSPFDFTRLTPIGKNINADHPQIRNGLGFDHCWVFDKSNQQGPSIVLVDPVSGRKLEVSTTEPGVQFYSGNFLNGSLVGKYNQVYYHRSGLCLETQHFPDSPNHPEFPSIVLNPGERYQSQTIFRFYYDH